MRLTRLGEATLNSGLDAPARGRRLVARWLAGNAGAGLIDDAILLVSEVVTNRVLYGGGPAGAPLRLRAARTHASVRIEVAGAGHRETDVHPDDYGLQLLDALAARWGIERDRGTVVWFELEPGRAAGE